MKILASDVDLWFRRWLRSRSREDRFWYELTRLGFERQCAAEAHAQKGEGGE